MIEFTPEEARTILKEALEPVFEQEPIDFSNIPMVPAEDTRLICNGRPFPVDCRVISEANFQKLKSTYESVPGSFESRQVAPELEYSITQKAEQPWHPGGPL